MELHRGTSLGQNQPCLIPNHTDVDYLLQLSVEGIVRAASRNVADVLGWDLPRAAEEGMFAVVADEAQRAALRALWRQLEDKGIARGTVQLSSRAGLVWLDIAAKTVGGGPGVIQVVHVSARDVTDDMAATAQLTASEREWRIAFEHSPIGGALLEHDGSVLLANDALCAMLGWRQHELSSLRLADLLVADSTYAWQQWWEGLFNGSHVGQVFDHRISTSDGRLLWSRLSAAAVPSGGSARRVMLQVQDITERREAELQLASRALHDGLTELPNRFLTRQWLASALEETEGQHVGVLYCDLDRFKIVNDSLGHAAGDQLLSQVASRLRAMLRPEDLVGRVGGDEFVVILESVRSAVELAEVAGRVAEALDHPFNLDEHLHAMTLSIGGALGAHPQTADELLMRADMALLRAKRLGRARFELYDPSVDHVATREDLQLEDDLRLSVASGELRAYYQPIVALSDFCVAGHEALLRWQHPEHGLLPPARFLELAESSGLIRPLGWWILTQACQDAVNGRHGLTGASNWVAVNASPSQLARPGMAKDVTRALTESGLRPERLHLEITETALITASATLLRELRQLTEMGVRIALDDFGTGYSSLSLLRQFPVDVVKIDRSFIEPLLTDRTSHAIVKAVLGMCQDMGLRTVAEGIEREDQRDMLLTLGCSHGQGYLFGHPKPLRVSVPLLAMRQPIRTEHTEALA